MNCDMFLQSYKELCLSWKIAKYIHDLYMYGKTDCAFFTKIDERPSKWRWSPQHSTQGFAIVSRYSLFTSHVSSRNYKNWAVFVPVWVSVSTVTAELFEVRSRNLVQGLTLIISWTSSMVKVIGQRSRSPSKNISDTSHFSIESLRQVWHAGGAAIL